MRKTTGHLTEKNKKWYAVINLYENGKRKEKWVNLELEAKKGSKTEANRRLEEILAKYNSSDMYLYEGMTHAEKERIRLANLPVEEYIADFLESYKHNIAKTTYIHYKKMVDNRISEFFKPLKIAVKDLTGDEINDFYRSLRESGLKGTTGQRYHALLHLAFKYAIKRKVLKNNPCEQADRPKGVQYIGDYYGADKIQKLIECLDGDPIRMVVIIAAFYGLRRSEVLGLKWSAIDFEEKKIYVRHKVVEEETSIGKKVVGLDVMKTKSSYRTLPLIPQIAEELMKEKARQERMKGLLRGSYCKEYQEYICVDATGKIIKPTYVSEHFGVILRQHQLPKIRFHDLRHSCASLLLSNGVPMKMIQDWLGHSDMGTTANIYSHIDAASKLMSANVMGSTIKI